MPENISLKVLILSLDIPFYFKFKTITLTLKQLRHVKPLKILGDQHCHKHFHSRPSTVAACARLEQVTQPFSGFHQAEEGWLVA